jgi:CRP/FNR family transcriptional regulator, cyclic AMP receptor protein
MQVEEKFIQTFQSGETIFAEGSSGSFMYVVVAGAVEIRRKKEGVERKVAELGPGEIFGELAVVDSEVRMATAIAIQDGTQLVAIDQARFVYLTSQQPAFALTVMRVMAERIRIMGQIIDGNSE